MPGAPASAAVGVKMTSPHQGQRRAYIDVNDEFEFRYWCKHLKVAPDELRRAIEKVGNSAAAVRKELGKE